ncbi:hypothetical protein ACFRAE_08985 [Sphingobacterium sp. HJSM2_6]|uniref:hypothetical protein n=1 Tax=Sphingobacterium sp. HJSM2_6 TaxID=3366264 RepID=UPI003BE63B50
MTQILANQSYLKLLGKGYRVFKTGMGVISDLKRGELDLHSLFFQTLKDINPYVRRFGKVEQSIAMQTQLMNAERRLNKLVGSPRLSADERAYVIKLRSLIVDKGYDSMEEMLVLLLEDKLSMSDKLRLEQLQGVHQEVQRHYHSLLALEQEVSMLIKNRNLALKELLIMKSLHH